MRLPTWATDLADWTVHVDQGSGPPNRRLDVAPGRHTVRIEGAVGAPGFGAAAVLEVAVELPRGGAVCIWPLGLGLGALPPFTTME